MFGAAMRWHLINVVCPCKCRTYLLCTVYFNWAQPTKTICITNSSSEAQQTKPFGYSYTGTSKRGHWSMEPPKSYVGKAMSNKYVFSFLRKASIVSDDLIVIGSWFQIVGAASEKARLPIFSLALGTQSYCLEMDTLSGLSYSEVDVVLK